jgi:hypothetical protein
MRGEGVEDGIADTVSLGEVMLVLVIQLAMRIVTTIQNTL